MAQTEIVELKVIAERLKIGMYVCRLDRSWLDTPYTMQGFLVESEADIDQVRRFCEHVFIDEKRSVLGHRRVNYNFLEPLVKGAALERLNNLGFRRMREHGRPILMPVVYPPAIELAKELPRARAVWKQARIVVNQCIARAKTGKALSIEEIENAVEPVIESVVRSPDAAMWLAAQRRSEPYPISHPLNCCALVIVFARFLGFPPEILLSLAKAAWLFDIGMWRLGQNYYIDREVKESAGKEQIREHVLVGLEYLSSSEFMDPDARLAILHHHEQNDGGGYPRQVRGDKVSLMGFMLQLVDTFDAMCSKRSYSPEHTLQEAQRALYQERDVKYPAEVVEAFVQSLGVYPTGSLVELSNGEIAAVSGQSSQSRLYPRLVPLTTADGQLRSQFREVSSADLINRPLPLKITRGVPLSTIGIRLEQIELTANSD